MSHDWKSRQWSVTLNLTAGRTVSFGNAPVKLAVELNYYVERPDAFGPRWMVGLNITPVVPNFVEAWFKGR